MTMPEKSMQERRKIEFVYFRADASISCDNMHLAKGTNAKIIYKLLKFHLDLGRSTFEYREFKYDTNLFRCPKATNFEIYLGRAKTILTGRFSGFHLEKLRPGIFRFYCEAPEEVKLRQEESYSDVRGM